MGLARNDTNDELARVLDNLKSDYNTSFVDIRIT